jgi:hypothetical protein
MHYSSLQVTLFITQLLAGHPVEEAYCKAVGDYEARQAWRWVNRLTAKIGAFRGRVDSFLALPPQRILNRSRRLTLLLEPLQHLLIQGYDLSLYQANHQANLM